MSHIHTLKFTQTKVDDDHTILDNGSGTQVLRPNSNVNVTTEEEKKVDNGKKIGSSNEPHQISLLHQMAMNRRKRLESDQ
jgi:hypothetical protein